MNDEPMKILRIDVAKEHDVLAEDVIVNDVTLFESGTELSLDRIRILESLGVESVVVLDRARRLVPSVDEAHANIDARFNYVEGNPIMQMVKYWVKDIVREMGEDRE